MCDPLTIAGVALSGASMLANQQAAARVNKARDNAMVAEADRQRALREEAGAISDTSRERYTNFGQQQGETSQRLGDYFAANTNRGAAAEQPMASGAGEGNVAVNNEIGRQVDKAKKYGAQQNQALGELRAFGDTLGGIGVQQARDAGYVGQLGSFKRASADVLPMELEAANSKGGGARVLGDVLNLGGRVAIGAGLAGKGPSFGDMFNRPSAGALHTMRSTSMSNAPGSFGFFSPY
jgi:hypothetical protein